MKSAAAPLALSVCLLAEGCAPWLGHTRDPAYDGSGPGAITLPAIPVYQSSTGPLSYRATVSGEGPAREVHGEACQSALTLPVGLIWAAVEAGSIARAPAFLGAAWGDGGYAQATADALAKAPGTRLTSVRADLGSTIILGVWRQQCVKITALAVPLTP
jgi:hypothetical protein